MLYARIRGRDGSVRWVRLNGFGDSGAARQWLQGSGQIGGGDVIEMVTSAEYLNSQNIPIPPDSTAPVLRNPVGDGSTTGGPTYAPGEDPLSANNPIGSGSRPPGAGFGNIGGSGEVSSGSDAATAAPLNTLLDRQEALPEAAIRDFLSRSGLPTTGVAGSIFQNAAAPAYSINAARGALIGQDSGQAQSGFVDFLNNAISGGRGFTRGLGSSARDILGQLAGISPGGGGQFANANLQAALAPENFRGQGAQSLVDTGVAGLSGLNPTFANLFGTNIRSELERRFDDAAFQQQQGNFARFLQSQLGLG